MMKLISNGRKTLTAAVVIAAALGMTPAPEARADTVTGCEVISGFWFMKGTKRSICDGALRPDGSWLRAREFWTPAYYKPIRTSCYGSYYVSCTTTGGYWVDRSSDGVETYVVYPDNVLPDEPPHLVNSLGA